MKKDHEEIRLQLWVSRMLMLHGDCEYALERIQELEAFVSAHFSREESLLREFEELSTNTVLPPSRKNIDTFNSEKLTNVHGLASAAFREVQGLAKKSASESDRFSCFETFETSVVCALDQEERNLFPMLLKKTINNRRRKLAKDQGGPVLIPA